MLWEIVNRAADQFLGQAESVPQDIPVEEQMTLLVRGHLEVIARELHSATVFFQEWKFLEPKLRDKIKVRRDTYEAHFRRVIEEGIKQNVFHVQDACIATMFVFSTLNWTYQWFHPDGPLTIEQLADQYNIFIMRALKEGQQ